MRPLTVTTVRGISNILRAGAATMVTSTSTTAAAAGMSSSAAAPSRHPNVAIFLCEMQESFRNEVADFNLITKTAQKVIKAANILSIPIHTTEQNPTALGPTIPELSSLLPKPSSPLHVPVLEKMSFSMLAVPEVAARLKGKERREVWTVGIVGVEAHVCVAQTALDLCRAGHRAYVLADGVGSVHRGEVGVALRRLRAEGATNGLLGAEGEEDVEGGSGKGSITVTSSESFLFEVMRSASIPEFDGVLRIIKEMNGDTARATARMTGF